MDNLYLLLIAGFLVPSLGIILIFIIGPMIGKRTKNKILGKNIPWYVQVLLVLLISLAVFIIGRHITKQRVAEWCQDQNHSTQEEYIRCKEGIVDSMGF